MALKLFDEMTKVARIMPNATHMDSVFRACAELRDLPRAIAYLREYESEWKGRDYSVFMMNSLLLAAKTCNNADLALQILREMRLKYGVTPSAVSYSIVLYLLIRERRIEEAFSVLDSMPRVSKERRVPILYLFLETCIRVSLRPASPPPPPPLAASPHCALTALRRSLTSSPAPCAAFSRCAKPVRSCRNTPTRRWRALPRALRKVPSPSRCCRPCRRTDGRLTQSSSA
jgi:pentatricopeptide repeat protein